jgi:hypothetical protein
METGVTRRKAIAQVVPVDKDTRRGTAFVITPDLALTAFHCVGRRVGSTIDLTFEGSVHVRASTVDGDEDGDLALLKLSHHLPDGFEPVPLVEANVGMSGSRFVAEGFGLDRPPGSAPHAIDGHIVRTYMTLFDKAPALQLHSPQLAAGANAHQLSGGPVLVAIGQPGQAISEAAVGVVRWQQEREDAPGKAVGGDVYATPIARAAARWPAVHDAIATYRVEPAIRRRGPYLDPWQVFERVRPERFVGRGWLDEKLDAFLAAHDRGYVIVEAQAGVGKTAYLAHLVRERGWLHHFAELPGGTDGAAARRNLAAQLRLSYGVGVADDDAALDEQVAQPDFLEALLREAAARLEPHGRLVIVVDGLDEAAAARPGENVFGLPATLPKGVFLICSTRPSPIQLTVQPPRLAVSIDTTSEENLGDLQRFLQRVAGTRPVRTALTAHHYSVNDFVETLMAKSGGLWVYVTYVLAELESRDLRFDLGALPDGIWDYYAKFWLRWKDEHREQWDECDLPLLGTLAAMRSAASVGRLSQFAEPPTVGQLEVPEEWRAFLDVTRGTEREYRLYHKSLEDFLHGHADEDNLLAAERDLIRELALATHRAHTRVSDYYLTVWGGLEAGLPNLADAHTRDVDDRYGLDHLAYHLSMSRPHKLHTLLATECPPGGDGKLDNAWFKAHEQTGDLAGYLDDIAIAWNVARAATAEQLRGGDPGEELALEYGYALVTASLNSFAGHVPSPLRIAAVRTGASSAITAIAEARRLPPERRVPALHDLATCVARSEAETLLEEALRATSLITDERSRSEAFDVLAGDLPDRLTDDALDGVGTITNELWQAHALTAYATRLPESSVARAFEILRGISNEFIREDVIAVMARHLPSAWLDELVEVALDTRTGLALAAAAERLEEPDRTALLAKATKAARKEYNYEHTALALIAVADRSPEAEREPLLKKAIKQADKITDRYGYVDIDAQAARDHVRLEVAKCQPVRQALKTYLTISDDVDRSRLLLALAERLPAELAPKALKAARKIDSQTPRANSLVALADHLPADAMPKAIKIARAFKDPSQCARALLALAAASSEPDRNELLAESLRRAEAIKDESARAATLIQAAQIAGPDRDAILADALRATLRISDDDPQAQTLRSLSEQLPDLLTRPNTRAETLGLLSEQLPESVMRPVLARELEAARRIGDHEARAQTMVALAGTMPTRKAAAEDALRLVPDIADAADRASALAVLIESLPQPDRQKVFVEALETARAVTNHAARASALLAVAEGAPTSERTAVFAEALQAASENDWTDFCVIAARLPPPCMEVALITVGDFPDGRRRVDALDALVAHLPDRLIEMALDIVLNTEDEANRAAALAAFAPHLPPRLMKKALRGASSFAEESPRAAALEGLAAHVPREMLPDVLKALRTFSNEFMVEGILVGLVPHLPDELIGEALAVAQAMQSDDACAGVLEALAERLSGDAVEGALQTARSMKYEAARIRAMVALSARMPQHARVIVLADALEATASLKPHQGWDPKWDREKCLALLARRVPVSSLPKVLAQTRKLKDPELRTRVLAALVERGTPRRSRKARLAETLACAEAVRGSTGADYALVGLAERMPFERSEETLRVIGAIRDPEKRGNSLIALAERLPSQPLAPRLIENGISALCLGTDRMSRLGTRKDQLPTHVARLYARHGTVAIQEVLTASRGTSDRWQQQRILVAVAKSTESAPATDRYAVWTQILAYAAGGTRDEFMSFRPITDILTGIGGSSATLQAWTWATQVTRWWP